MNFVVNVVAAFLGCVVIETLLAKLFRLLGFYTIVQEGTCQVYVLFGKVIGVLGEPGFHVLPSVLGPSAFIVNWLGTCRTLDMRLDQEYLRSEPVNSEEGAPMGIGIWYEMRISDPVSFLFKNTDPRGSLSANVSNSTVRCLSNMPLSAMLETRHQMSHSVREEVSQKSEEWGYTLGSVYIRKVHFRDLGMIQQIEQKVVNRLRQVTSAIRQAGANQVSVIKSSAEREAAVELAKAAVIRPATMRAAFAQIASEPKVCAALFEILETQRVLANPGRLVLLPRGNAGEWIAALQAAGNPNGSRDAFPDGPKRSGS
jgi:regulator of protease activity HflC (stomatin/prohibitin superfamily)